MLKGSSGSRLEVYKWKHSSYLPQILRSPECQSKVSPGITSFLDDPRGLQEYLKLLLNSVEDCIERRNVKVFVLATAGMRLLSQDKQNSLLRDIAASLDSLDYPFHEVRTITGNEEGIFGWLSLNYLMGKLRNPADTLGMIDLGGASVQIAFSPLQKSHFPIETISLKTGDGKILKYDLFSKTFLGFGTNEYRKKYVEYLMKSNRNQSSLSDPCLFEGFEKPEIFGTGDYDQCSSRVHESFVGSLIKDEIPFIDHEKQRFYGVSEFWYTTEDVFEFGGIYDYQALLRASQRFCSLSYKFVLSQVRNGDIGIEEARLEQQCFKSAYMTELLHEGFGFSRDFKHFRAISYKDDMPVSWTIGALLFEIAGEKKE